MTEWGVTFWDVGQGDASDIRLPTGGHILIDSGPLPHKGNPLPQWYEDHPGEAIDLAIVTHNHVDHFGGFVPLAMSDKQTLRRFILLPDKLADRTPIQKSFESLLAALRPRAESGLTKVEWAKSPQVLYSDGVLQLRMLHPQGLQQPTKLDANVTSMIIALETVSNTPQMLIVWAADTLLANVCKVCHGCSPAIMMGPHHGKAQDCLSAPDYWRMFKSSLHPDCIFVSVGRDNVYHHPDRKYIVGAANANVTICCSEISDHCDQNPQRSVYPGSAMLGLPQPPSTYQCRGSMKVWVSPTGVRFDQCQDEYLNARAAVYSEAPCKPRRFFTNSQANHPREVAAV